LLYGPRATDVFLQPVTDTVICPTAEGAVGALVARVLSGEAVEGLEISVQGANGQRRDVLSNSFPLHSPQGDVLGGINASMDITKRRQQEEQLKQVNLQLLNLAMTDGLTGLKNYRAFKERLAEEFTRAHRYQTPLSLILLDVDHFKTYNDSFGHPAGDIALKAVADLLQATARDSDFVARYGGEEFAVLLPHTDEEAARISAERLRSAIEQGQWPHRPLTASIGVATLIPDYTDPAVFLSVTDQALYTAKAQGRNRAIHAHDIVAVTDSSVR
jgi:diguanylate cyclase (GGDEF)-like protein